MRVATIDKTGTYYNISDHLGSASLELNTNGEVVQKLDYLPFGEERLNEKNANFATHFTYTNPSRGGQAGEGR